MKKKKIAIIGYGSVGRFLVDKILNDPTVSKQLELVLVWNRTASKLQDGLLPKTYHLTGDLPIVFREYARQKPLDLIVELAHPDIIRRHGPMFLEYADLFISSITSLADQRTESLLRNQAEKNHQRHGVYLPVGAGWGLQDIRKMDQLGTLRSMQINMSFNADSLLLREPLKTKLDKYLSDDSQDRALELYQGNVREIAQLAPNNVNTMCVLALAAPSLGMDKITGRLIAQKEGHAHQVEIEVVGPGGFQVRTVRYNPAKKRAVTGSQTYYSFLSSLLQAGGMGNGMHFC